MTQDMQEQYDAVVVGGGAAGLAGALMLARCRRSVVVVDGVHQALLFRQLSDDVTLLRHTLPPTAKQDEQLQARGIRVVDGRVAELEVANDRLTGARLADGGTVPFTALVVATQMRSRTALLAGLGLAPVDHPFGVGDHLTGDPQGRTDAPGVWVAGNVTDLAAQVGAAASAGAAAGAAINGDLVMEETRVAVDAFRAGAPPRTGLSHGAVTAGAR